MGVRLGSSAELADDDDADAVEADDAALAVDEASGETVEMPLNDAMAPAGRPQPPERGLPFGKIAGATGVLERAVVVEQMYWTGGELDESTWT